jgi:hypothetical protein
MPSEILGVRLPNKSDDDNLELFQSQTVEYQSLRNYRDLIIQLQKNEVPDYADLPRLINNDVKRTDISLPHFKADSNPDLTLLRNVLTAYALFNTDTRYVQGMGDLVSPFIVLLIKKWTTDDRAELFDGRVVSRDEAEALIFWMLNGILTTTEQDRMFTNLNEHQTFALERVAAIAMRLHEPLNNWFGVNREISQLE